MGFLTILAIPAAKAPARLQRPAPALDDGAELSEADLAHVVGGLARTLVDDTGRPIDQDLTQPDRRR